MGNSQGKESQPPSRGGHVRRSSAQVAAASPAGTSGPSGSSHERSGSGVGLYSARSGRGSRHDLSFLGIGGSSSQAERDPALEPRRETKAEREARKLEKERVLRAQERERSIKEEGVDGAFLVTLGTYTGPEDFSKPTVRQLQVCARSPPLRDLHDVWILTCARLSGVWLLSGRVLTTTPILGPSTSSWPLRTVSRYQLLTRSRQKSRLDRPTTSAPSGIRARLTLTSTISQFQWARVACHRTQTVQAPSRHRIPPSLFPRRRLQSHRTRKTHPPHRRFSADERRRWRLLPAALAMPHRPRWPLRSCSFLRTHT